MDRRQFLKQAGVFGAAVGTASWLPGCKRPAAVAPVAGVQTPDWTAGFFTDPHVYAEKDAARGFAQALDHAFAAEQAPAPSLVLTGGDLAFDILEVDRAGADAQYDLFDRALASLRVPIHHTLGNHDCFGVYESSGVSPDDPAYGKTYYCQRFKLDKPYYAFDHEGWHFVVLDTIGIPSGERAYEGRIDAEQLRWLADDLAANQARPTIMVGHIPLFTSYLALRRGYNTKEGFPGGLAVINANEVAGILIKDGQVKHPQVKLVLAGHLHVNETFLFRGIEFANIGAVSGNWWNGLRDGFEEGYALLEFRGDQVAWRYVDYGWEAAPAQVQS